MLTNGDITIPEDSCNHSQSSFYLLFIISNIFLLLQEWAHGMPIQCPKCLLIIDEGELVVSPSENEGQVFHPTCFTCIEGGELLTDLIHCSDVEGRVYCLRHYNDLTKKR